MPSNPKTVTTQDYEEVVAAVQHYVDGMRAGDPRVTAQAFHPDAVMYGYAGSNLLGGPISNLYGYVESSGQAPELRARIDVLAITPTTAVASVELEKDATGSDFTDYHALLKQDGRWVVIAKLFHHYG